MQLPQEELQLESCGKGVNHSFSTPSGEAMGWPLSGLVVRFGDRSTIPPQRLHSPANKSVIFAKEARAAIRCSAPLYPRSQFRVCPVRSHDADSGPVLRNPSSIALRRVDSTAEGGPRPSLRGVPSSTLLAGERIFHPLARPARRQRLFPSGQLEEFVSANLQFPFLNSQWPPPPFLHPYRPRTRHPSSSSARLSSSAPAVPAM
jgi:hypothetical protein